MGRDSRRLIPIGAFCFIALGLLSAGELFAQWLPEANLTNETGYDKYTSYNTAWCVAADTAGDVHVVWYDSRGATWPQIHWMERVDTTWSGDTVIVGFNSRYPCIVADPFGDVHLVWTDDRDPGWGEIYYKTRNSSGWFADMRLTVDASGSEYPCTVADGKGNLHVVWQDGRDGNREVYYKMRDSLGNWQTDERLTTDAGSSRFATVAADTSGDVHVSWADNRIGNSEIYYRMKDDHVWLPETLLTPEDSLTSILPSASCDVMGRLHLVWHDYRDGHCEVYYKVKEGNTWSSDSSLTLDGAWSQYANMCTDPFGNIHVVWADSRDGYRRVYYKTKDTSGAWSADVPVSASSYPWEGIAQYPSVAADKDGNVHVVWYVDYYDSSGSVDGGDIYYREKRAPIGVEETPNTHRAKQGIALLQNSPNPFHHSTLISYTLPQATEVTLSIYDIAGRLVETLVNETQQPGIHQVQWDRKTNPSGVYFYRLQAGESMETRKMVVVE